MKHLNPNLDSLTNAEIAAANSADSVIGSVGVVTVAGNGDTIGDLVINPAVMEEVPGSDATDGTDAGGGDVGGGAGTTLPDTSGGGVTTTPFTIILPKAGKDPCIINDAQVEIVVTGTNNVTIRGNVQSVTDNMDSSRGYIDPTTGGIIATDYAGFVSGGPMLPDEIARGIIPTTGGVDEWELESYTRGSYLNTQSPQFHGGDQMRYPALGPGSSSVVGMFQGSRTGWTGGIPSYLTAMPSSTYIGARRIGAFIWPGSYGVHSASVGTTQLIGNDIFGESIWRKVARHGDPVAQNGTHPEAKVWWYITDNFSNGNVGIGSNGFFQQSSRVIFGVHSVYPLFSQASTDDQWSFQLNENKTDIGGRQTFAGGPSFSYAGDFPANDNFNNPITYTIGGRIEPVYLNPNFNGANWVQSFGESDICIGVINDQSNTNRDIVFTTVTPDTTSVNFFTPTITTGAGTPGIATECDVVISDYTITDGSGSPVDGYTIAANDTYLVSCVTDMPSDGIGTGDSGAPITTDTPPVGTIICDNDDGVFLDDIGEDAIVPGRTTEYTFFNASISSFPDGTDLAVTEPSFFQISTPASPAAPILTAILTAANITLPTTNTDYSVTAGDLVAFNVIFNQTSATAAQMAFTVSSMRIGVSGNNLTLRMGGTDTGTTFGNTTAFQASDFLVDSSGLYSGGFNSAGSSSGVTTAAASFTIGCVNTRISTPSDRGGSDINLDGDTTINGDLNVNNPGSGNFGPFTVTTTDDVTFTAAQDETEVTSDLIGSIPFPALVDNTLFDTLTPGDSFTAITLTHSGTEYRFSANWEVIASASNRRLVANDIDENTLVADAPNGTVTWGSINANANPFVDNGTTITLHGQTCISSGGAKFIQGTGTLTSYDVPSGSVLHSTRDLNFISDTDISFRTQSITNPVDPTGFLGTPTGTSSQVVGVDSSGNLNTNILVSQEQANDQTGEEGELIRGVATVMIGANTAGEEGDTIPASNTIINGSLNIPSILTTSRSVVDGNDRLLIRDTAGDVTVTSEAVSSFFPTTGTVPSSWDDVGGGIDGLSAGFSASVANTANVTVNGSNRSVYTFDAADPILTTVLSGNPVTVRASINNGTTTLLFDLVGTTTGNVFTITNSGALVNLLDTTGTTGYTQHLNANIVLTAGNLGMAANSVDVTGDFSVSGNATASGPLFTLNNGVVFDNGNLNPANFFNINAANGININQQQAGNTQASLSLSGGTASLSTSANNGGVNISSGGGQFGNIRLDAEDSTNGNAEIQVLGEGITAGTDASPTTLGVGDNGRLQTVDSNITTTPATVGAPYTVTLAATDTFTTSATGTLNQIRMDNRNTGNRLFYQFTSVPGLPTLQSLNGLTYAAAADAIFTSLDGVTITGNDFNGNPLTPTVVSYNATTNQVEFDGVFFDTGFDGTGVDNGLLFVNVGGGNGIVFNANLTGNTLDNRGAVTAAGSTSIAGDVTVNGDLNVTGVTTLALEDVDTSGTTTGSTNYKFVVVQGTFTGTRDANTIYLEI